MDKNIHFLNVLNSLKRFRRDFHSVFAVLRTVLRHSQILQKISLFLKTKNQRLSQETLGDKFQTIMLQTLTYQKSNFQKDGKYLGQCFLQNKRFIYRKFLDVNDKFKVNFVDVIAFVIDGIKLKVLHIVQSICLN